ncbi:hypothetical protein IQ07DRAFT_593213 [Pyrenochaeta sp. DS3sAY3a]|nr:hypothetical protein IQ07DRAFT_593213 [Pyrenochaeta sp. DS3sAY3a]
MRYEKCLSKHDLPGVTRITQRLTRDCEIFKPQDELISQCIVVTSCTTFHTRHGPNANKKLLKINTTVLAHSIPSNSSMAFSIIS